MTTPSIFLKILGKQSNQKEKVYSLFMTHINPNPPPPPYSVRACADAVACVRECVSEAMFLSSSIVRRLNVQQKETPHLADQMS